MMRAFYSCCGVRAPVDTGIEGVTLHHLGPCPDPKIALRAAAPLRKPVDQADVDGLGLFDAVRSPRLL